jgi:hypothetical protein
MNLPRRKKNPPQNNSVMMISTVSNACYFFVFGAGFGFRVLA